MKPNAALTLWFLSRRRYVHWSKSEQGPGSPGSRRGDALAALSTDKICRFSNVKYEFEGK